MKITYRPEVDGLRAVAVVAVILYHAEFAPGGGAMLEGGYPGVDIFFVISGHLISKIILTEFQATGRIDFVNFYILPTRAWELLAGAMLARLDLLYGRQRFALLCKTMPALGVLFIAVPLMTFDGATHHPGFAPLLPVLRAAMVVFFANPPARAGRNAAGVTGVCRDRPYFRRAVPVAFSGLRLRAHP